MACLELTTSTVDRVIVVKGGEDFAFSGFSMRVIPSLHSALDGKHTFGAVIAPSPKLPLRFSEYEEGGSFIYLVRIAGRQILAMSTANFIERELEGLRPDIAIIAPRPAERDSRLHLPVARHNRAPPARLCDALR